MVYDDGTTSTTETRTYDAFGRAVRIERDGVVLDRIHAGTTVLREVSPCADRIWWPSEGLDQPAAYTLRWESGCLDSDPDFPQQLAAVDLAALTWAAHETALVSSAGMTLFVLQDLRGDVVGLTDTAGTLLETYDYDLFGARSVMDGAGVAQCASTLAQACGSAYGNPLGYTGRPLSAVSGLYDMRARHYDPHLRQWTAPDPLGYVDGFDVWGYVGGDPLNFTDPFGTKSTTPGSQSGHTTSGDDPWQPRRIASSSSATVRVSRPCRGGLCVDDPLQERKDSIISRYQSRKGTTNVLRSDAVQAVELAEDDDELDQVLEDYPELLGENGDAPPGSTPSTTPAPTTRPLTPGDLGISESGIFVSGEVTEGDPFVVRVDNIGALETGKGRAPIIAQNGATSVLKLAKAAGAKQAVLMFIPANEGLANEIVEQAEEIGAKVSNEGGYIVIRADVP